MPFTNADLFKKAVAAALRAYYTDYRAITPTHYQAARDLETRVNSFQTKEEILDAIYAGYCDLVQKNSDKLALSLSLLIANELDISQTIVRDYHRHMHPNMYLTSGRLSANHALKLLNIEEKDLIRWEFRMGKDQRWNQQTGTLYKKEKAATFGFPFNQVEEAYEITLKDPVVVCYEKRNVEEKHTAASFIASRDGKPLPTSTHESTIELQNSVEYRP